MAVVARNAYKGYTYQEYIHLFFTALMDTEKKIAEIEAEIISEHNFDDLYILFKDQTKYFVQIKNHPQTELSDISISDDEITIGTNKSKFANNAINIVIINTSLINETNAMVFGLPCVSKLILELFDLCNLDINWDKLYLLYKKFMDISLIFI